MEGDMDQLVGINWQISTYTGWGNLGLNIALHLLRTKTALPVPLHAPVMEVNPLDYAVIEPMAALYRQVERMHALAGHAGTATPVTVDFPIIHGLANDFAMPFKSVGSQNIGTMFFENTRFTAAGIEQARFYDVLITGSRFNYEIVRSLGFDNVHLCWQGIDPTVFHPAPKSGLLADRFVIFSGGSLGYRKGQDLVLAAFKIFRRRHPEALLLAAWHNVIWPEASASITRGGHVATAPRLVTDRPLGVAQRWLDLTGWVVAEGVPPAAFIDAGVLPNQAFGPIMREADVALFPNRCEGGTNLVAMECLACGVPTILSRNTGHLDLIEHIACYPLTEQRPVQPLGPEDGVEGWGESSVDEIVATLEEVYQHREAARERGRLAARQMEEWTWARRMDAYLDLIALPAA
jgi:glycosyltransferase involved in cell wall biosynthesis